MVFEYDENKNQANIKKHGIDFEEAISARQVTKFEKKKFGRVMTLKIYQN